LERQLGQAKVDQILSARDRVRPFEEAVQRMEDETRLMTTLKLTLRQREIDFQVPKRTIELLGEALPARHASKPNWVINLVLALIVGVMLGVGVAILIEYFDTSFRNLNDVETRLGVPVLGVIPRRVESEQFDPDDLAAVEPFRVLQTNLNLTLTGSEPRAIAIVSAGPGEGKSTTINRLAQVVGLAGETVVLVDADLRRPTQHRLANIKRGPGLSDYLSGAVELDEVIQIAGGTQLATIAAGTVEGFTLGLVHTNRLKTLIDELKKRYDRVLVDSPPIIGVSDASVLATAVDGALLLIQHRRNPQAMTVRAQQTLQSARTPLWGAILNQVPVGGGEDYGYYTHNYNYYGEESKQARKKRVKAARSAGSYPTHEGPETIDLEEPDR